MIAGLIADVLIANNLTNQKPDQRKNRPRKHHFAGAVLDGRALRDF
jgi:hypothetical protein